MDDINLDGPSHSPQEGIEELEGVLSEARQIIKRWNHRLTFENLTLTERYLNGELVAIVCIHILGSFKHTEDLCAIFKRKLPIPWSEHEPHIGEIDIPEGSKLVPKYGSAVVNDVSMRRSHEYRKPVFFADAGLVQSPESVIPSTVRFEFVNNACNSCPGSLYFSHSVGFKFLKTVTDWETAVPIDRPSVSADEVTNQMVERRTEIMNYLSDDNPEFQRNEFVDAYPDDPIPGLRLFLSDQIISAALDESLKGRLQITDLLFGPFDFGSRAG